jgi:hypothetical protein
VFDFYSDDDVIVNFMRRLSKKNIGPDVLYSSVLDTRKSKTLICDILLFASMYKKNFCDNISNVSRRQ